MNTLKKRILSATVVILLIVVAYAAVGFWSVPTKTIQDLRAFCEGLDSRATMSDVLKRAADVRDESLKTEVFDQHKVLVRLQTCHCFVNFAETGTTASKVVCNG